MIRLERTDSTNRHLHELAAAGAPHGTAVLATEQTAGKGRLGRIWLTAPGEAVLLSVLVRSPLPAARVPLLTLGAAVAVAESVPGLGIKWPNDLLAPDGRKVAGVLAQAEFSEGRLDFGVLGIGLNVHGAPALDTATCLDAAFPGRSHEVDELALAICGRLLSIVDVLARDPEALLDRWREASVTLGRTVRIGETEGVAQDIDATGALLVRTSRAVERVLAGDVEMVAAAGSSAGGRR